MSDIRFTIDGKEVTGSPGQTILDVANENGIHIPTLCYDERMEIYGGCGLCVVESKGNPKLLRACATVISQGMDILTQTPRVEANRKVALELLLTDHTGDCLAPCIRACPAHTDCQGYVGLIANGEFKESLKLIKEQLILPASIGRVCPHPCEDECRRQMKDEPVAIAWHKRFAADMDLSDNMPFIPKISDLTGKRVAVVGGGPGGLSAAHYLRMKGHRVVVYDMMPAMGGMLRYGIPQYRLPKEVLAREIQLIADMGIEMINNVRIGKDITLDELRRDFDAVYLSIGCWNSTPMRCKGEDLEGVFGGIDFLREVALSQNKPIGKKVAVIGGGNTAMDACRTAVRLGAEQVYTIYRRTREEMPAEDIEITEAEEEGVLFKYLVNPVEITGIDDKVCAIRLQKMVLGEPDASGRRRPVPIEGDEEVLEVDTVIIAIGQSVNLEGFESLQLTKYHEILTDRSRFATNLPGVFAGGDAVNDNQKIAIQAIADGKNASGIIDGFLKGEDLIYEDPYLVIRNDVKKEEFSDMPELHRPDMEHLTPSARKTNFDEVVIGFTPEAAMADARRCLECGCHDYFECTLIRYSQQHKVSPQSLEGDKNHREADNSHPFILQNPDKCILCGLCVRACHEIMDVTALGLADRGFETIVKPAMDKPLKKTDCISCGLCVSVCPTGAFQEKLLIDKAVPLKSEKIRTTCSFCGVGCQMDLERTGRMLLRALPVEDNPIDQGVLCVRGRFGFDSAVMKNRIQRPLLRKNGELISVTWDEAINAVVSGFQHAADLHTPQSIGVSISAAWSNEEIFAAKCLAERALNTPNIYSLNRKEGTLCDVFGMDASPNTLDELLNTDLILLIGSSVMRDHTIAALKIKQAVKTNGKSLIVINPMPSKADEWASLSIHPSQDTDILCQLAAALLEKVELSDHIDGLSDFKDAVSKTSIGADARKIAARYLESPKALIVSDETAITGDAVRLIGAIAVLSGHIGKPGDGIVLLRPQSNSQGIASLGITGNRQLLENDIANKRIRSLLLLGENADSALLGKLDFLVVADTHFTPACQNADVVLPASSFAESDGTVISTERRILSIRAAIPSPSELNNLQFIAAISQAANIPSTYDSPLAVAKDIEKSMDGFKDFSRLHTDNDSQTFWPIGQDRVLYRDRFARENGCARFVVPICKNTFENSSTSDYKTESFYRYLAEEELDRR